MFRDVPVIDAHALWVEDPLSLPDHLDPSVRRRIRLVAEPEGAFWVVDDRLPGGEPRAHRCGGGASPFVARPTALGGLSWRVRLAEMDREGIDVQIVYPTSAMDFVELVDGDLAVALCRAYNDAVAAHCAVAPARLVPVGVLPVAEVSAATEELRRCVVDLGMPAVALPAVLRRPHPAAPQRFPEVFAERSLAAPELGPLLETAEFLDVAIAVAAPSTAPDPAHAAGGGGYLAADIVGRRAALQAALARLIVDGVLERFPRLRFGFLGAGCGWLPDFVFGLCSRWARRSEINGPSELASRRFAAEALRARGPRRMLAAGRALRSLRAELLRVDASRRPAAPALPEDRHPEEYFARGQVFATFVSDDPGPLQLRSAFGPVGERLACWSTGYGGWGAVVQGAVERTSGHPELAADLVQRLMATNALRFYGERLRRRLAPGFPRSRSMEPRLDGGGDAP